MCPESRIIALAFVVASAIAAPGWTHSWTTALDAQMIDFGYQPLDVAQAADVASHYRVVSLEKCSGGVDKTGTEAAIYASAKLLKAAKPRCVLLFGGGGGVFRRRGGGAGGLPSRFFPINLEGQLAPDGDHL